MNAAAPILVPVAVRPFDRADLAAKVAAARYVTTVHGAAEILERDVNTDAGLCLRVLPIEPGRNHWGASGTFVRIIDTKPLREIL